MWFVMHPYILWLRKFDKKYRKRYNAKDDLEIPIETITKLLIAFRKNNVSSNNKSNNYKLNFYIYLLIIIIIKKWVEKSYSN